MVNFGMIDVDGLQGHFHLIQECFSETARLLFDIRSGGICVQTVQSGNYIVNVFQDGGCGDDTTAKGA